MPAFQFWFSGAALAAMLVFAGAGYGWYRAALSEQQSAEDRSANRLAAEARGRLILIEKLTQEYIRSHDNISPAMLAGLETPPRDWLNHRLSELKAGWQWNADGRVEDVQK